MIEQVDELYSLLVPLAHERLLVPRSCVAEVIGYQPPAGLVTESPWLLGSLDWSGRTVPIVAFEGVLGERLPEFGPRCKVAVFYALTGRANLPFFGIVTQGFPQLVRVSRKVLSVDQEESFADDSAVLCRLHMLNEHPLVPDLERLEGMLEAALENSRTAV